MPKTKCQNFIFTLITAVVMAYCMIVYSVAINSSEGLINQTFLIALKEFPTEEPRNRLIFCFKPVFIRIYDF